jgi:hypothetical protein
MKIDAIQARSQVPENPEIGDRFTVRLAKNCLGISGRQQYTEVEVIDVFRSHPHKKLELVTVVDEDGKKHDIEQT